MNRLVVVKQTAHTKSLGFSEVSLSFPKPTVIPAGWSHARLPFDLELQDGGTLPFLHSKPSQLALTNGIWLAGGDKTDAAEFLAFFFNTGTPVEFDAGEPVVVVQLVDVVRMRQHVDQKASKILAKNPPKSKKKK